MKTIKLITIGLAFFIASSLVAMAQFASPLAPGNIFPTKHYFGLFIGLGQNIQRGTITPNCPSCEFEKGNKFGFTAGLLYDYKFMENLYVGATLEYNYLGIDAYFREIETHTIEFESPIGTTVREKANVRFQHEANVDIHNLALMPYIKYEPLEFMFLRLGFNVGYNLTTDILHRKTLDQKVIKLSNGEVASAKIPHLSRNSIVEDGELAGASPFQMYLSPAVGFNLKLGEELTFSPVLSYSKALTNISTIGDSPQVDTWRLIFELRIDITPDREFY